MASSTRSGSAVQLITDEQRRWRLARRHRLIPELRTDDVAAITDDLVALHSSDPATVFLSALVRMHAPSTAAVHRALYDERSVLRHHSMRRTIWVMTPETARLAHGAATAKIAQAERKRTVAAMRDTTDIAEPESWLDDALSEIYELLAAEGPLTTRAIGQALPDLVVPMRMGATTKNPATLNAHTKVLQGAGFDANLMRSAPSGDWTSAEYAWVPTETWAGGPIAGLDEETAAGALLERWLLRFGPATETDITWWFGWTATLTRKALAAFDTIEVALENGETALVHASDRDPVDDPGPWVRLLPGLDPTVMGWKQRDWYLDPGDVADLFDRFGNAGPTIWADGRVVGGWVQRRDASIAAELTQSISSEHQRLLDDAIAELEAAVGDTLVRPRFPAPMQKRLFAG